MKKLIFVVVASMQHGPKLLLQVQEVKHCCRIVSSSTAYSTCPHIDLPLPTILRVYLAHG